ncbi:hypothetical protein PGQ11_010802 [Apiospora arundinis]|uniref:Uncharacterized protein n=1 Tax=Apiospora arundinis TaxID=335852 RepID=A0ABR2IBK9_9PEZI
MSSESNALCYEGDVAMDLQEPGCIADEADSFCSPCLPDGFDALLRFNNECDDVSHIHDAPATTSSQDELRICSCDPVLPNYGRSISPDGLPNGGAQARDWSGYSPRQPNAESSELAVDDDKRFELDDFYNLPGLEWNPELLVVPSDEADDVTMEGLAACETGPQCFNCGSPVEWDETSGLLAECEVCFCPN